MRPGANMEKLVVLRRALDADGRATGDFGTVFETWARWSQSGGFMAEVNGQREDKIDVVATVNDCRQNRTISNSDRVQLACVQFEIDSAGLPERKSGTIALMLKRAVNS